MDESTPAAAAPPPMHAAPPLAPKDHAEAVAIFRSEIVGALTRRDLDHGELRNELRMLSQRRYRPPGIRTTRRYSVTTLERWYYAYRSGGLAALRPAPRKDRGHARDLGAELRQLLIDIRREHRSASVPLILRTLTADGRLASNVVSQATVHRLYADHGLDRIPAREGSGQKTRLRWEAESPGALWHADVRYGPTLTINGQSRPLRIHALLDDASPSANPPTSLSGNMYQQASQEGISRLRDVKLRVVPPRLPMRFIPIERPEGRAETPRP
jgi:putative transposase